jgi:hypothetical protein
MASRKPWRVVVASVVTENELLPEVIESVPAPAKAVPELKSAVLASFCAVAFPSTWML